MDTARKNNIRLQKHRNVARKTNEENEMFTKSKIAKGTGHHNHM